MLNLFKNIKDFKYWGKELKRCFIVDIIRGILWLLAGAGLYLCLNNTGLLIYLILMVKCHWFIEESEKKL